LPLPYIRAISWPPNWIHIFFHNGLLGGHTLFSQLGCFGLDKFILSINTQLQNCKCIKCTFKFDSYLFMLAFWVAAFCIAVLVLSVLLWLLLNYTINYNRNSCKCYNYNIIFPPYWLEYLYNRLASYIISLFGNRIIAEGSKCS